MAGDPEIRAHKEWLGLLQPVGLVVSPPALLAAQVVPNRNVVDLQQRLLKVVRAGGATGGIGQGQGSQSMGLQLLAGWRRSQSR